MNTSKWKQNKLRNVNAQLRKILSEAQVEMDRKSWERISDIALYETKQHLEPQRLELLQANQWADQPQRENNRLLEEN